MQPEEHTQSNDILNQPSVKGILTRILMNPGKTASEVEHVFFVVFQVESAETGGHVCFVKWTG